MVRSAFYLVLPVAGTVSDEILAVQRRFDPRLAAAWPPHATLAGSSGMGPIPGDVPVAQLRDVLEPIAHETAPIELPFGAPMRFMQSDVVVLPLDPHGPLRALHERVKLSGLPYAPPRFAFTPHVTLSFYPELDRERLRELLSFRLAVPVRFEQLHVYRSFENRTSRFVMNLPLG